MKMIKCGAMKCVYNKDFKCNKKFIKLDHTKKCVDFENRDLVMI